MVCYWEWMHSTLYWLHFTQLRVFFTYVDYNILKTKMKAVNLTSALFWDITQSIVAIPYRRFGITWRFHVPKFGPTDCPETLVRNYHYSLYNIYHRKAQISYSSRRKPEITQSVSFKYWLRRRVCGYAVTHLVEALRYKPEGRGFGFPTVSVEFFFDISFRPHYGPGIDSTSNINEYQEYSWG